MDILKKIISEENNIDNINNINNIVNDSNE